jgi:hypothetical protein
MKRLATVFALTALAAGGVALAQQSSPSTSAAPPASSSSSASQDSSASTSSASDKQALMKRCLTQVQAANPNASAKDIQAYCEKQVSAMTGTTAPQN